jgi:ubiquinone/menaquinone biosynthesis C-methylase UbiE
MAEQSAWQQVSGSTAEVYERHQVPALMAPLAPRLVAAGDVHAGEHILDVACGTGVVTRLAAERVGNAGRVVGLDFNAAMLGVARSLPPIASTAIEWIEASALDMPLPDAAFDAVLCQHGVQQFPDRPAGLAEMRRVLKPAGRLAVSVWGQLAHCPGMAALVAALQRHVGDAAANNRRAPFSLGDAAELERLVNDAGFHDVQVQTVASTGRFPSPELFVQYQLAATPLSNVSGVTDDAIAAVIQDVSAALQTYITADGLVFPMEAHIVTARA